MSGDKNGSRGEGGGCTNNEFANTRCRNSSMNGISNGLIQYNTFIVWWNVYDFEHSFMTVEERFAPFFLPAFARTASKINTHELVSSSGDCAFDRCYLIERLKYEIQTSVETFGWCQACLKVGRPPDVTRDTMYAWRAR